MPVSVSSSQLIFDALKACDIRLFSALPETWLVHLIRMAEDDPEVTLVRLAKEEEGVGISAGAHLAGVKSAMLMQNHGFLASVNGIVSLAHLYKIPLLMLISYRGEFGELHPWQTQGGGATVPVFFKGVPPDLFTEGKGAVVEGRMGADGVFQATMIMAKHAEDYSPHPDGKPPTNSFIPAREASVK